MNTRTIPSLLTLNNPGAMRDGYGVNYQPAKVDGFSKFNHLSDGLQSFAAFLYDANVSLGKHSLVDIVMAHLRGRDVDRLAYLDALRSQLAMMGCSGFDGFVNLNNPMIALVLVNAMCDVELGQLLGSWPNKFSWISLATITASMVRANRWPVV